MDQVKVLYDAPRDLVKEGTQFMTKCTKPDKNEYLQICRAVAMGFAIMGGIGYVVKLVHIPINHVLVGGA
ncbi:translocation complex subunit Sss1 [Pseudohyphozyma bogoriensis]|nr:translocation complex subunit Sss1 [Pseudohyphozyma bogoriensis]